MNELQTSADPSSHVAQQSTQYASLNNVTNKNDSSTSQNQYNKLPTTNSNSNVYKDIPSSNSNIYKDISWEKITFQ